MEGPSELMFCGLYAGDDGFWDKWRRWMNACITTTFAVLINGDPSSFFQASRGLRQGDPLSLFIAVMEGLNVMGQGVRFIQWLKRGWVIL